MDGVSRIKQTLCTDINHLIGKCIENRIESKYFKLFVQCTHIFWRGITNTLGVPSWFATALYVSAQTMPEFDKVAMLDVLMYILRNYCRRSPMKVVLHYYFTVTERRNKSYKNEVPMSESLLWHCRFLGVLHHLSYHCVLSVNSLPDCWTSSWAIPLITLFTVILKSFLMSSANGRSQLTSLAMVPQNKKKRRFYAHVCLLSFSINPTWYCSESLQSQSRITTILIAYMYAKRFQDLVS